MRKIALIALAGYVQARTDEGGYPDLDDYKYVNYAEQQNVVYDYIDH